jgi:methylmalonyl-CoA decarboxylase subunit alpha
VKEQIDGIAELKRRTLDEARGAAVTKQHDRRKLTARERLSLLCDGDVLEYGQLAGSSKVIDRETPADGVITGIGTTDGRKVAFVVYDFTVLGGSQGDVSHHKVSHIQKIAISQGVPCVYLCDGGGARVQEMDTYAFDFPDMFYDQARMSGWVPLATAIMGPCFAGHANIAGMSDYVVMVTGSGSMGVAGTHLVRASMGRDVDKEELGGPALHCNVAGTADDEAPDDRACIGRVREFLGFLPSNARQSPPTVATADPADRRDEALATIVPESARRAYDIRVIIRAIADEGRVFELKPAYARNVVTAFVRMNGRSVGIVANQPMVLAGALDSPGAEKMSHFVELCDAFNVPLVLLADIPGVLGGPEAERTGVVRRSMKTLYTLGQVTVPVISIVIRKAYGMGGYIMGSRAVRPNLLLAWPGAELGAMGLEGAVETIHRKRLAGADDPAAERKRLVDELRQKMGAVPTARAYGVDDVIDPRDTRAVINRALEAFTVRDPALPPRKHGIMPV